MKSHRARPHRSPAKGLELPEGPEIGQALEFEPEGAERPPAGGFRVIGRRRDGRVRILKRYKPESSSGAIAFVRLAAAAGAFVRVEVQRYDPATGWTHTAPVCKWEAWPALELEQLGPLFEPR